MISYSRTAGTRTILGIIIALIAMTGEKAVSQEASVALSEGWLFAKVDDPTLSAGVPGSAVSIPINTKWEDAGYNGYDGFGWYFKSVTLAPELRDEDLVLFLGKIDDADEVYINGTRVGSTGGMPPAFETKWEMNRSYIVPKAIWKEENRIAVRIYDGGGGGGFYSGVPKIMTKTAYDAMMRDRFKPHRSFHQLPFSNGLTSSKVNLEKHRIDSFREHIYSNYDEQTRTRDFCRSLFFGSNPATPPSMEKPGYIPGTGIVRYTAQLGRGSFAAYIFAPMDSDEKKLYYLIDTRGNASGKMGFAADFDISGNDRVFSQDSVIVIRSGSTDDYITLKVFAELGSVSAKFENGFIEITSYEPESEWFGLSVTFTRGGADRAPEPKKPSELIWDEEKWWEKWHAEEKKPEFKTREEEELFAMSTAILKMGQCRESGKPYGQILASIPPGHWNICWIRDGSYAINGLILANHLAEAKDALTFFLEAECGKYRSFVANGRDYGVGVPYRISVCRYYGDGTEESDGGKDPNIELDGFGLFLWVFERYIDATGDMDYARKYADVIFREISDVIIHCVEKDLKIMKQESGPWERHIIDNGYNGARRFSYTSATAYRGLVASVKLANKLGRTEDVRKYRAAADALREGFLAAFVSRESSCIRGLYEDTEIEKCLDAGAVEGINFEMVSDSIARATLDAFDRHLRMKFTPGYARNDDGGDYDRKEWVVIDLRIASAFARLGEKDRYETIMDWVTMQSARNFNLIGELYTVDEADYSGAVPMCGFGPGAYITALRDRERVR